MNVIWMRAASDLAGKLVIRDNPCRETMTRSSLRLLAVARTLIRVDGFPVKVFPEPVVAPVFGGDPLTSMGISGANLECT